MDIEIFLAIAEKINYRFSLCYPYKKPKLPSRWYHDSTAIRGQRKFFTRFLNDRSFFIMPGYGCLGLDFLGGFHGNGTINIKERFLRGNSILPQYIQFNSGIFYGDRYKDLTFGNESSAQKTLLRYKPQHTLLRSYTNKKIYLFFWDWENQENTTSHELIISDKLEILIKYIIGVAYAQYLEQEYIMDCWQDNKLLETSISTSASDIFNLGSHPFR